MKQPEQLDIGTQADVVRHRLDVAREDLLSAQLMIEAQQYRAANNRAYYTDRNVSRGVTYQYYVCIDIIQNGINISDVKSNTAQITIPDVILSAKKTNVQVKKGKQVPIKIRYTEQGYLNVKVQGRYIVGAKWKPGWDGDYCTLYLKGLKKGKTKVVITNTANKEKIVINVTVK